MSSDEKVRLGGRYDVIERIGTGSDGIIWHCYDETLGEDVAIKEYSAEEVKRGRYISEAKGLARFRKAKDIINVYDVFQENEKAYMVMEYVDWKLFREWLLEKGGITPAQAASVLIPILKSMHKIHAEGIIHCDLGPDNIFIKTDKNVTNAEIKVFDFGRAVFPGMSQDIYDDKPQKQTGFIAPEIYHQGVEKTYGTDIYSVGAIWYRMLTGITPTAANMREKKDMLLSPLKLGVDIDDNIDRTIMEAMAIDPMVRIRDIDTLERSMCGERQAVYPTNKKKTKWKKMLSK